MDQKARKLERQVRSLVRFEGAPLVDPERAAELVRVWNRTEPDLHVVLDRLWSFLWTEIGAPGKLSSLLEARAKKDVNAQVRLGRWVETAALRCASTVEDVVDRYGDLTNQNFMRIAHHAYPVRPEYGTISASSPKSAFYSPRNKTFYTFHRNFDRNQEPFYTVYGALVAREPFDSLLGYLSNSPEEACRLFGCVELAASAREGAPGPALVSSWVVARCSRAADLHYEPLVSFDRLRDAEGGRVQKALGRAEVIDAYTRVVVSNRLLVDWSEDNEPFAEGTVVANEVPWIGLWAWLTDEAILAQAVLKLPRSWIVAVSSVVEDPNDYRFFVTQKDRFELKILPRKKDGSPGSMQQTLGYVTAPNPEAAVEQGARLGLYVFEGN